MDIVLGIAKALGEKKFPKCKIFVLNAQSDEDLALEMIKMFRGKGILCWDRNCILVGQDHRVEQEKAIYDADFVIVLFSKDSLEEEGRYARLLRLAYEAQLEKGDGGIKLIAVLIEDDCRIPHEYRKYEPMDLTTPNSFARLVQAFEIEYCRRERLKIKQLTPQAFWG